VKKAKKAKTKKTAKKTAKKTKAAKAVSPKKASKKPAKKAAPKKAKFGAEPDHRCKRTLDPGTCLKFFFNPASGEFDDPPEGLRVPCSACEKFF
jgi:hypothetical protein